MVFISLKERKKERKNTYWLQTLAQYSSSQFSCSTWLAVCSELIFSLFLIVLYCVFWRFIMLMFCVSGWAVCALCCRFSVSVMWVCVWFRAGYRSAGLCWRSYTPEWLWGLTAHRKHTTLTPSSQTLRWYTIAWLNLTVALCDDCLLIDVYVFVF